MQTTWRPILIKETRKPYFKKLQHFVSEQRQQVKVFPPDAEVFAALHLTPIEQVKVLILGQDPYHDDGQAHGLCFSVRPGIAIPPSLLNIFKELRSDLGCKIPNNGYLKHWAEQGVLLLNSVLTVQAHQANSHQGKGWETFTDAVIAAVNAQSDLVMFVLWGANARKKMALIDTGRHLVIESPHPSPLSAHRGFFGSRPFSRINAALRDAGKTEIDWQIPDL
ncbi:uracil-DNA glycosylase [Candidatus Nitrotoga sp. M5]|uniref:uracil-DNA glycosylase n=1 Tax=Candidatus Nitrotoga sp. M5 TaxID=2890409 RepID=UPI001EF53984|nr:uracil-DNA glycosylase [Candidatus Nitrotoga sp. M5]CAH1387816.1 uracil-DNA glycosylase [Candidatus Nitrotoga sp. M5]